MDKNPWPTQIKYRKQSKILEVSFDDEQCFELSAEYLRVYSPSAEVRGHGPGQELLQVGKEQVGIKAIEAMGNYAVRLVFDDGHNSGIYTWKFLHELGLHRHRMWDEYLHRLKSAGHSRHKADDEHRE